VVLAPCRNRIAVSRQIEEEGERTRLADLAAAIRDGEQGDGLDVEGMDGAAGWVIRTAAIGMEAADMAADMASVAGQWEALLAQAEDSEPPAGLYQDLGAVEKALRDLVRAQTTAIVIEDADSLAQAKAFASAHMPAALGLVQGSEKGEIVFDRYDIASQLEQALSNRVSLASGGWLMIETTEAMTTIDVNSGGDTADARGVNLAAAHAIGRQLRLRALGGLVAIDFIDMSETANNDAVLAALEAGFQGDKNPVRIGPMSEFGVVEMTRRRDVMSLAEAMRQRVPSDSE
jgi:ribonuclease G